MQTSIIQDSADSLLIHGFPAGANVQVAVVFYISYYLYLIFVIVCVCVCGLD